MTEQVGAPVFILRSMLYKRPNFRATLYQGILKLLWDFCTAWAVQSNQKQRSRFQPFSAPYSKTNPIFHHILCRSNHS